MKYYLRISHPKDMDIYDSPHRQNCRKLSNLPRPLFFSLSKSALLICYTTFSILVKILYTNYCLRLQTELDQRPTTYCLTRQTELDQIPSLTELDQKPRLTEIVQRPSLAELDQRTTNYCLRLLTELDQRPIFFVMKDCVDD